MDSKNFNPFWKFCVYSSFLFFLFFIFLFFIYFYRLWKRISNKSIYFHRERQTWHQRRPCFPQIGPSQTSRDAQLSKKKLFFYIALRHRSNTKQHFDTDQPKTIKKVPSDKHAVQRYSLLLLLRPQNIKMITNFPTLASFSESSILLI